MTPRTFLAALAALLGSACASGAPPAPATPAPATSRNEPLPTPAAEAPAEITCEQLVDHLVEVGALRHRVKELGRGGDILVEDREYTAEELQAERENILGICHSQPDRIPASTRECIMRATTGDGARWCGEQVKRGRH